MFCGNCGKEIENSATFCPECGAAVAEHTESALKHDRQKVRKMIGVSIVVIVAIAIAVGALKIFSYMQGIPSSEEIQNAVNNVQNGAIVTTDGTWLYYNDNGLCKVKLKDGTKQTVISSDIYAEHMFYIGNKLYYYTFPGYCVLEGKTGKDLGFSIFTEGCIQSDGSKFYVTGTSNFEDGGVYSCKVGNIEKGTKLSDIHPTQLLLQGEYLYVISGFSSINDLPNEDYGTWRMNKNGKNLISVFEY